MTVCGDPKRAGDLDVRWENTHLAKARTGWEEKLKKAGYSRKNRVEYMLLGFSSVSRRSQGQKELTQRRRECRGV